MSKSFVVPYSPKTSVDRKLMLGGYAQEPRFCMGADWRLFVLIHTAFSYSTLEYIKLFFTAGLNSIRTLCVL